MKGSGMGVRFRVRLEVTWTRGCKGSRVRTGVARDTLRLEGLKVRLGEDGISEGRHLCKRHIVCSWGWKAVQVWAVGRAEGGGPGEDGAKGGSAFLPGLLITDAGMVPCPVFSPHHKVSLLFAWSLHSRRKSRVPPSAGHRPHRGNSTQNSCSNSLGQKCTQENIRN